MRFFKENGSTVIRLIITHIGMAVFGMVMFFATNMQGPTLTLLTGLFSAVFYGVIVYSTMWEYGAKDKPAIDAERLSASPVRAFLSSFIAQLLLIIAAVIYFVCCFVDADALKTTCYVILILLNSCFTGIMLVIKNALETELVIAPVFILGSLYICGVATLGYALGSREITIVPKKNNKK